MQWSDYVKWLYLLRMQKAGFLNLKKLNCTSLIFFVYV